MIPEIDIELYTTGFGDDILGRKSFGLSLSTLLETAPEPLVLAIDGGWGSGKTIFLKQWVGAHSTDASYKATMVYFDAFKHDFLDEPLLAITGTVYEQLNLSSAEDDAKWNKIKRAGAKIALGTLKGALSFATGGASRDFIDGIESDKKDGQDFLDAYWTLDQGKRQAMQEFRETLEEYTKPDVTNNSNTLIIVIDELDRCRPDYALSVLEIIKHFFNVKGVQFVLGVNIDALQHSVKARYGSDIDAEAYLRRFINHIFELPHYVGQEETPFNNVLLKYIEFRAKEMNLWDRYGVILNSEIANINFNNGLSLRDINKILSYLSITPILNTSFFRDNETVRFIFTSILVSLIIIMIIDKNLYKKIINGDFSQDDLLKYYNKSIFDFGVDQYGSLKIREHIIYIWEFVRTNGRQSEILNNDLAYSWKQQMDWFNIIISTIPTGINKEYLTLINMVKPEKP